MREGETTEGREGSRGTVRKAAASRHPSQNPVPFPAPLILPFFRPPSLVFSIPSEVTTACMSKRRSAPQGGWLRHPLRSYVNLLEEGKER